MSDTTLEDYRHVLAEAVERLISKASGITSNSSYDLGRKMAYFEILQEIQNVVDEVGIDKADEGLAISIQALLSACAKPFDRNPPQGDSISRRSARVALFCA